MDNLKGSSYEAYFTKDQSQEIFILKAYKTRLEKPLSYFFSDLSDSRIKEKEANISFKNEVYALTRMSRLIVADDENKIIVQKKIYGELLGNVLSKCFKSGLPNKYQLSLKYKNPKSVAESDWGKFKYLVENHLNDQPSPIVIAQDNDNHEFKDHKSKQKYFRMIKKYQSLADNFHTKFNLVHNDIHPFNVIVDSNEELVLIDFGRTEQIVDDREEALAQIYYDKLVADGNILDY